MEATISPGTSQIDGLDAGEGGVWASDVGRVLAVRFDPDFRSVVARVRIGSPTDALGPPNAGPTAVGADAVWRTMERPPSRESTRNQNTTAAKVDVGNDPAAIAVDEAGVWVADRTDNTVTRIDPESSSVVCDDSGRARPYRDRARIRVGVGRQHAGRHAFADR